MVVVVVLNLVTVEVILRTCGGWLLTFGCFLVWWGIWGLEGGCCAGRDTTAEEEEEEEEEGKRWDGLGGKKNQGETYRTNSLGNGGDEQFTAVAVYICRASDGTQVDRRRGG